eukprot:754494-Hanusia_phi.AAC.7
MKEKGRKYSARTITKMRTWTKSRSMAKDEMDEEGNGTARETSAMESKTGRPAVSCTLTGGPCGRCFRHSCPPRQPG